MWKKPEERNSERVQVTGWPREEVVQLYKGVLISMYVNFIMHGKGGEEKHTTLGSGSGLTNTFVGSRVVRVVMPAAVRFAGLSELD